MPTFSPRAFYGRVSRDARDFSESDDDISVDENYIPHSEEDYSSSSDDSGDDEESIDDDSPGDVSASVPFWVPYTENIADFPPVRFSVNNPGVQVSVSNCGSELDFFQLFFTDELVQQIVKETNRYAREKISSICPLPDRSIWKSWKDVTVPEFKAFLGVLMNMALNPKPDIKEYFSMDTLNKMPFFPMVFSRDRFLQIFWALHVPQDTGTQPTRGSKMRSIVKYIDGKCREHFSPGQKICVDESTVGFKGRISFKCYNPQKPTKWGLRIYVLADCVTGYISAFEPYYGSTTTDSLCRPDLPFTCRIVLHLLDKVKQASGGSGYHLYTDRYYTSPQLAEELLCKDVLLTGTVMTNRKKMPGELKKKMKKGDVAAYRHGDEYMVLAWQDKRQVTMLSSAHNCSMRQVTRTQAGGQTVVVEKPFIICDYTENMGAVDRADHYCASYAFTRKSVKWWRKLFFWIIEVAVVNSFLLMRQTYAAQGLKMHRHLRYRRNLIEQLVGSQRSQTKKRGPAKELDADERLDGRQHFIYKIVGRGSKDCAVCSDRKTKGGRRETVFFCKTCSKNPGLHPGECFEKYHTVKKYRQSS